MTNIKKNEDIYFNFSQTPHIPLPGEEYRRQETGDNPPLTPPRRGRMGMSEEVGVRIVRIIFLPNYAPKILTF
ncbi:MULTISPECIES: hypothetical protein [Okeania]|uniref:hypothetical protein n=1 Tax=Okeania TaxID=1458928 RepID=UPI000F547FA1|nr:MULTISPECIES: hypothetical protein [Okeania]NET13835.1 hypothetical protein [Okeania sp. SIO1H6]NES79237.1 hypothetical protein [Okeania sp. SIO1H4]NET19201.1 hypothetical protein [Okeania sp. SIO1H5]NET74940.1 hypothetical protein [Okeania sp. SIO1F9]NET93527.1 hypothetical protein [Okeania sp. SIO1H2]